METALSKTGELEKRIAELERKNAENSFNFIRYESVGKTGNAQEYAFSFKVEKNCILRPKIALRLKSGQATCELDVNGVAVKSNFTLTQVDCEIECCMPFSKGNNAVSLKASGEDYDVEKCEFEIFGCVNYSDKEVFLSVINEQDRSVILFVDSDTAFVKSYKEGRITDECEINPVRACSICPFGAGYVLSEVAPDGVMNAVVLGENLQISTTVYLDEGISSACSVGGSSVKIYAVRGRKVFLYVLDEQLNFSCSDTGYRAKKVSANPEIDGYIILTDFDGNNKLVAL